MLKPTCFLDLFFLQGVTISLVWCLSLSSDDVTVVVSWTTPSLKLTFSGVISCFLKNCETLGEATSGVEKEANGDVISGSAAMGTNVDSRYDNADDIVVALGGIAVFTGILCAGEAPPFSSHDREYAFFRTAFVVTDAVVECGGSLANGVIIKDSSPPTTHTTISEL